MLPSAVNRHASIGAGWASAVPRSRHRTMQQRGIEQPMEIAVARDLEPHVRHARRISLKTPSAICIRSAGASSSSDVFADTRKVQQVIEHAGHLIAAGPDASCGLLDGSVLRARKRHLGAELDRHQRRAQVVNEPGDQQFVQAKQVLAAGQARAQPLGLGIGFGRGGAHDDVFRSFSVSEVCLAERSPTTGFSLHRQTQDRASG